MAEAEVLGAGERLGRFIVLRQVGAGGMGAVYEARDPDLERSVALKVLRARTDGSGDSGGSLRLAREAQALAQLSNPNIVAVHDFGVADGRLWIAMEFIDGETLDVHLAGRPHSWREVVALFVQAGRGLAAAHGRSIIHRDFKPSNVIVDGDGRVRVTDFGLARAAAPEDAEAVPGAPFPVASSEEITVDEGARDVTPAPVAPDGKGILGTPLTQVGAYLGTPRYMAPEQRERLPATARSDQYAFCVAFWEALFGEHPFPEEQWVRRPQAPRGRAPRRLVRLLEIGLAPDPADRHASLGELVDELERLPARRRRVTLAAAAALLVGATAAGALLLGRSRVDCGRAGAGMASVWTPDARGRLAAAFAKARPYGGDSAARVSALLDAYARRWQEARVDACRATHERGEQSAAMLDRRAACLEDALGALDTLVSRLVVADGAVVDNALAAVSALPAMEGCTAARVGSRSADPRAKGVRQALDRAVTDYKLGHTADARKAADEALAAARALGDPSFLAAALAEHVRGVPDDKQAQAELDEALGHAARSGDRDVQADVALRLFERIVNQGVKDRIEAMLPVVRAAVAAAPAPRLAIEMPSVEHKAMMSLGRIDEAFAACDRMAALETASDPGRAAECRCTTANSALRTDVAGPACDELLRKWTAYYGADHPNTARALNSVATVRERTGHPEEAVTIRERALAVMRNAYGESREVAILLQTLSSALANSGRFAESRDRLLEALAIAQRISDRPTKMWADLHEALGKRLAQLGERDQALAHADEALRLALEVEGPDHPDMILKLFSHASTNQVLERWAPAAEAYQKAAALAEKLRGPEDITVGLSLASAAACLSELKQNDKALPMAERALAIIVEKDPNPRNQGEIHAVLGSILAEEKQYDRARSELQAAHDLFVKAGKPAEADLKRLDTNLRKLNDEANRLHNR